MRPPWSLVLPAVNKHPPFPTRTTRVAHRSKFDRATERPSRCNINASSQFENYGNYYCEKRVDERTRSSHWASLPTGVKVQTIPSRSPEGACTTNHSGPKFRTGFQERPYSQAHHDEELRVRVTCRQEDDIYPHQHSRRWTATLGIQESSSRPTKGQNEEEERERGGRPAWMSNAGSIIIE
jgi:hypothetical protein